MAKTSKIVAEKKKIAMVEKYRAKRDALRAKSKDKSLSEEERYLARVALNKMPRDSSPSRVMNRCQITGRPKGVYRKFKLGRNMLRLLAMFGNIPGLVKASW